MQAAEGSVTVGDGKTALGSPFENSLGIVAQPTSAEAAYLRPGLHQPGRKLPLFDGRGRPVRPQVIRACLARGWAERWFANPLAPDWLVCRLTDKGAQALER